jgi:murein DD-endopeptidase MepM/ murein hydrolase activator NlpD
MSSRCAWLFAIAAACGGDPHVINGYESMMGIQGQFRTKAHSGLDYEAVVGAPVLAVADGVVVAFVDAPNGVGRCVLLEHHCSGCEPSIYFTSYCHLRKSRVRAGQPVVRGQQIAEAGRSGRYAGREHLHFSMCKFPCTAAARDGDFVGTMDPMRFDVGCFDRARTYVETRHPILTHPIVCTGR